MASNVFGNPRSSAALNQTKKHEEAHGRCSFCNRIASVSPDDFFEKLITNIHGQHEERVVGQDFCNKGSYYRSKSRAELEEDELNGGNPETEGGYRFADPARELTSDAKGEKNADDKTISMV